MQRAPEIRAFPWEALDTLPREALTLMRDARRAVRHAIDDRKIGEVLSELVGDHASIVVAEARVASGELSPFRGIAVVLATPDDGVRIEIEVEPELARTLVSRVIGKPARLGNPRAPTAPEIEGGLAALVCAVARRAHGAGGVLRLLGPGGLRRTAGDRHIEVQATVLIGPEAYAARALVELQRPSAVEPIAHIDLASLGEIPISLPVIAAASTAKAIDIFAIEPGDVWLPGRGWSAHGAAPAAKRRSPSIAGDVFLSAPGGHRGMRATIGDGGEIVVLGVQTLVHDEEKATMGGNEGDSTGTSEIVLDAPLVVRVEIGAVTLTAREWAALRPGDVIAVGRRVQEPVVLRVAGLEVARGELVDIEGELGVRIREQVKSA